MIHLDMVIISIESLIRLAIFFSKSALDTFGKIYINNKRRHNNDKPWYNRNVKLREKKNHKARSRYNFVKNKENRKLMKTASKEYKNELTKYFQSFQTRFENGSRNTSKTDTKMFWSILNRIDRSNEMEEIYIDYLYEYFKGPKQL